MPDYSNQLSQLIKKTKLLDQKKDKLIKKRKNEIAQWKAALNTDYLEKVINFLSLVRLPCRNSLYTRQK